MKKRIYAAILSALLAAGLLLNLPVAVRADAWDDTISHYDGVFAAIDGKPEMKFKELYTALLLDPETFLDQLAFRGKETKEYVLSVLTGDWVTLEQWQNIKDILNTTEVYSHAVRLLMDDIKDYRSYMSYQDVGIVTDCKALFDKVLTADGFYATNLAYDLAYAFIGTPEIFISELLEEEKVIQDSVIQFLQFHEPTFLGTKIYESIPAYIPELKPEDLYILGAIMEAVQNHPRIYPQTDPDPETLAQWIQAGYQPKPIEAYNYDRLFDFSLGERADSLTKALLNDTANFVNELAFRDIDTKSKVMRAFESANFLNVYLKRMYFKLESYQKSASLTKSETALLEAMVIQLDCLYYSRPQPHRDCQTLFAAALDIPAERWENFVDEVKFAFLDDSRAFIKQLAQEKEAVQDKVLAYLLTNTGSSTRFQPIGVQIAKECSLWVTSPDSYSEEEGQLLEKLKFGMPPLVYGPSFSDPDPNEYQQWLEEKGLLTDDPGMTLPIYPAPTPPEPSETAASEETQSTADEDPEKDIGWVSTICFTLGFLCIGIATGSVIAKKKKAKKARQAALQQAADPAPVKIYPKLLYCPAPLSRETQKQISQVLREKYDEYSVHWYSIKEPDGTCRCYGTENGYDVIFYAGGLRMEIPASCTVGECTFHFGTGFELYAHKDGILTDLNTALEQGLVSHQTVTDALSKHKSISK